VGGEDMVTKIMGGWTDYDAVIATPDMMKSAGKLGKVLGPRGLMPNPKTGTVTFDVAKAIRETRPAKWNFAWTRRESFIARSGKFNSMARSSPKRHAVINAVVKAKPAAAKGKYVKSITLTSTMARALRWIWSKRKRSQQRHNGTKETHEKAQRKTGRFRQVKGELAKVSTVILTTFQGITVQDDTKLPARASRRR